MLGGIVTIVTLLIFSVFSFYLGSEIFYKEKPIGIPIVIVNTVPKDIVFAVTFAFLLQDIYGSTIPNGNKLIDIQATYYDLINTNGFFTNQNPPMTMNMRLCNHSYYSPELSKQ